MIDITMKYVVKTVRYNGSVKAFNFGYMLDRPYLRDSETIVGDEELSITVFEPDEIEDYKDMVLSLMTSEAMFLDI